MYTSLIGGHTGEDALGQSFLEILQVLRPFLLEVAQLPNNACKV
jgi:hypothetical protein